MAAVSAGLRGHCPACAKAPLPSRRDHESCRCAGCGENFGASEVASAVPLFVAPVAAGAAALVAYALNLMTDLTAENQLVLLVPFACWIGLVIYERISGALVALQWALWIGHFDPDSRKAADRSHAMDRNNNVPPCDGENARPERSRA
ncbi:MAG: DUF983 domain-containing protein [Hyphomicrobium sp.]